LFVVKISEALAIALRHHQAGRWREAEGIYRRILAADPQQVDALHLLGVVANQLGRPEMAVDYIGRAVAARRETPEFHNNLGLAYRALARFDEAVACGREAIRLRPDYAEAHYNLGLAFKESGRLEPAAASFRRALELSPDFADAHNSLGVTLNALGRSAEAVDCYRRALRLRPDFAEVYYNLGSILKEAGKLDEATASYRRALEIRPDLAPAHNNLGLALARQRKFAEAAGCYRRAIQFQPQFAEAHNNLGAALASQGKFAEATVSYRQSLALKPDSAEAHFNLGTALLFLGRIEPAIAAFRQSLRLRPGHAETHNLLGNAWKAQGEIDAAIVCYRRAAELDPAFVNAASNLLLVSHYRPGVTLAELATLHAHWDQQYAAPLRGTWRPHENVPDPARRLRLGFLSADFGCHPVGYLLIRALENLDPRECQRVCYCDRDLVDPLTRRFQAAADSWREVISYSDQELAEQIRRDRIDILFELAGHTFANRLLVFARKPAPIQITWIGYEGTTGLRAIDYLLADRYLIPAELERHYPERILRLPEGYVCYDPPAEAPPVGPLPAEARGDVTFASFNNPAKITPPVVAAWAAILRDVPGARMILKYQGLDDEATRRRFEGLFAAQGVPPERIELQGWSPYADLLAEYQQVDLALDPFPFAGGVTTCNALWMGVPVITCPGETFASRHGLSFLSQVGLTETIATDTAGYVRLAVELAGDRARLAALRAGLRPRMAGSPLCDGRRLAEGLQPILREVWRRWCGGQARAPQGSGSAAQRPAS
jgi:predicted O-linked N-acetylglucosamine transferase (SPINDLY family)